MALDTAEQLRNAPFQAPVAVDLFDFDEQRRAATDEAQRAPQQGYRLVGAEQPQRPQLRR